MEFSENWTWHLTFQNSERDSPPAPKSSRDGPGSWQGSYNLQVTKHLLPVTPTLGTLQPAPEIPDSILGPSSADQHPALREQPTQIPCCSLEVNLNLYWSCVEPSSPVGHNAAWPCMEQLNRVSGPRWLDFCLQRHFRLTEIGADSPFSLLRDAWATGRKKY